MVALSHQLSSITSRFSYDPGRGQYYDNQARRYVTPQELRRVIDTVIDAQSPKVRRITEQLINGEITLAEWQTQVFHILNDLYIGMALVALGGINRADALTRSERPSQRDSPLIAPGGINRADAPQMQVVQNLLRIQYQYFREFVLQLATRSIPLNGMVTTRVLLYVQAGRCVYEETTSTLQDALNMREEKRVLGIAEHCQTCLDEAAKGWQPRGTLRKIGDSLCLTNCHCLFIYK